MSKRGTRTSASSWRIWFERKVESDCVGGTEDWESIVRIMAASVMRFWIG